jgi:hypothetical protein
MGLLLLLAARVLSVWCKEECGEVDCCGMEGCLGSVVRMQYFGPSIKMLADEFLVDGFAVRDLTVGLELRCLDGIDNSYSSSVIAVQVHIFLEE